MKSNINSSHRLSSIVKKNSGRPVNNHLTTENNTKKANTGKEKNAAVQRVKPVLTDMLTIRVRADEDRPE